MFQYEVWFADSTIARSAELPEALEAAQSAEESRLPAYVWLRSETLTGNARLVYLVQSSATAASN